MLAERKLLAARLVAEDKLSNAAIGKKCGVTARAVEKWKKNDPEFATEVQRCLHEYRERVAHCGIADRTKRVERLNADWIRLRLVRAERAKDPKMREVPGGKTGLMIPRRDGIGYEEDILLLRELRAIEEQAAKELGQWTEKHEHSGEVIVKRLIGVSEDEI